MWFCFYAFYMAKRKGKKKKGKKKGKRKKVYVSALSELRKM